MKTIFILPMSLLTISLLIISLLIFSPSIAVAASTTDNMNDSCTDKPLFRMAEDDGINPLTIVQDFMVNLSSVLEKSSQNLFDTLVYDYAYKDIIWAAVTLMIIFYAISFLTGISQLTAGTASVYIIRIGIIGILMTGWYGNSFFGEGVNFYNVIVSFFNGGTDCIINVAYKVVSESANAGVGSGGGSGGNFQACEAFANGSLEKNLIVEPFKILDRLLQIMMSPRMFVTLWGSLTAKTYGVVIFFMLGWSIVQILLTVVSATKVYALSMIARALLLGVAPIFFGFMLFEKTKAYFKGWFNQLLNFSLQPIIMFVMLAIIVTLLESAVTDILPQANVELCFAKKENGGLGAFDLQNWQFVIDGQVYTGEWEIDGLKTNRPDLPANFPVFPIDILSIVIFLTISYLGIKSVGLATTIAAEISDGITKLDTPQGGQDNLARFARTPAAAPKARK